MSCANQSFEHGDRFVQLSWRQVWHLPHICFLTCLISKQKKTQKTSVDNNAAKSASPSAMVLWLNEPPAAISSYRADSLLRPN